MKERKYWILSVAIIIGGAVICWASGQFDRKSLLGVKGVFVLVEDLPPKAKAAGLQRELFQTDVELKLRLAGIKVLSKEDLKSGNPQLYVNVNLVEEHDVYAVSTRLEFCQDVYLTRNPNIISFGAATWRKSGVLLLSREYLINNVRTFIKTSTDMFINDYLAANPKDQPSKKDSTTKTTQQTYVVPKNALLDMYACAALFLVASDPNLPQEKKAWARKRGLVLSFIQEGYLAQLGLRREDITARGSILARENIKDMPPEVFDYVNFEDYKKMSP